MDEIRKVIRQDRCLLITAVTVILITVSLVFIAQFLELRDSQTAVSASLLPAAVSGKAKPEGEHLGESRWLLVCPRLQSGVLAESLRLYGKCISVANQNQAGTELDPCSEISAGEGTHVAPWRLGQALPVVSSGIPTSLLAPSSEVPLPEARLEIRFLPRLALIIDDWGYDWAMADRFLSLDLPFTAAVLPGREKSQAQAALLRQRGHEVILHLPMEPIDPEIELDEGCITTSLDEAEIRRRVEQALASVGEVAGVNNHMGSKASSDERVVRIVLEVIGEHGLYFVDSRTAPTSVIDRVAAEMGIPAAVNQVFLDHYSDVDKVKAQIERLIRRAKRDGQAVGIGHVRPQTYYALAEMLPRFHEEGVVIVPASRIVSSSPDSQD